MKMNTKYVPRHAKKWYKQFDKLMNKTIRTTIGELVGAVLLTALVMIIGYAIAKAMLTNTYYFEIGDGNIYTSNSCRYNKNHLECKAYVKVQSYGKK